jgi:ubiquinone/menaquinone biosynthesis C-methylase UbiE
MTDKASEQPNGDSRKQGHYTHGYEDRFVDYLKGRTVNRDAAFFVRHLRSGMSLLDCGCGPGTISIDLAGFITPGQMVGIDIEVNQIILARNLARERGISNARFEVGDIYELPFPNNSFDAAFAHTVLQHLAAPVKAAREICRVLKPGGVFGVREEDTGGFIISPFTPKFHELMELYVRTWKENGGDPYFARRQRAVLREAGFVRVEGSASAESYGTSEATRKMGKMMAKNMYSSLETAIKLNWADSATVETLTSEWKTWGEHPDAFFAFVFCEAIGWTK